VTQEARIAETIDDGKAALARPFAEYSREHRPLGAYAALSGTLVAAVGGAALALRRSGRELPERPAAGDIVLIGTASHKVSRLLTKDKVSSFLRAPFTEFQEASGQGEVEERPRGRGLQLALGELLGCPYCVGLWVASGLSVGLVAAPRLTRFVASVFTAETISDFLQAAYLAAEQKTN
jgi:Protein of unknown function (DUF1360)